MKGRTCNAAAIRGSFCWKHLTYFSSSTTTTGKHQSSPVPPLHASTARSNRQRNNKARRKSPAPRPKPKPKPTARDSSSPATLFQRISSIVSAESSELPHPALPTREGDDVERGLSDAVCGQDARRVVPGSCLDMPGSEKDEQQVELGMGGALDQAEDLSPTVQRIADMVRSGNCGMTTMEDRLGNCGLLFTPEVVEMVLKRCFKARHSALRFFKWSRSKPGFRHTTATYNAAIYIAGEACEFNLVERLLDWMQEDLCPRDVKTWTILISHYGKAKQIGKALWAFEQMKKQGCEPDKMVYDAIVRALCEAGKAEIALEFYKEMVGEGMSVDNDLYQVLLNSLAVSGDVVMLRLIGEQMLKIASEGAVYSCLLKSFCISGRMEEAKELINEVERKDLTVSPGIVQVFVKGLCKEGRASEALEFVDDAKKCHLFDSKVYGHIIGGYLRMGDSHKALRLLNHIKEVGHLPTVSTFTEVIQHLFQSGDCKKACELYDEMLGNGIEPDMVAITAMVAGHVCSGRIAEAWDMFDDMKKKGMKPTWKAYSVFIKELCKIDKPEEAFKLLVEMVHLNLNPKNDIFRLVISSLRKSGEVEKVRKVEQMSRSFDIQILDTGQMALPSVQKESKILDYPSNVDLKMNQTLNRFDENDLREVQRILSSSSDWTSMAEDLKKSAIKFSPEFVVKVLRSCQKHGRAVLQFFSWVGKLSSYAHTTATYNMAIKISGSGKDFKYMRYLYQEMKRRGCLVTEDTWTIMIAQYGQAGLTEMALKKFEEMKANSFEPNVSTYKCLIMFLCRKKGQKVSEAIKVFREMLRAGYMPDQELAEIFVSCLCEAGKISDARKCVETLHKNGFNAQVGYSLFIRSLCRAGLLEEALVLVNELNDLGCKIDRYIYGSLVHGLLRGGQQEEALCKIEEMKTAGVPRTVHIYTSLIVHFLKEKHIGKAMEVFKKMKEDGCEPTVVTYSALIRGYTSVGMISDAWDVFYRMIVKGPLPDFHTYSMFMTCLCKVGRSEEGLKLLYDMLGRGIFPSSVNFRIVFYGLNREGKQDLARTVLQTKWHLARKRKFLG